MTREQCIWWLEKLMDEPELGNDDVAGVLLTETIALLSESFTPAEVLRALTEYMNGIPGKVTLQPREVYEILMHHKEET